VRDDETNDLLVALPTVEADLEVDVPDGLESDHLARRSEPSSEQRRTGEAAGNRDGRSSRLSLLLSGELRSLTGGGQIVGDVLDATPRRRRTPGKSCGLVARVPQLSPVVENSHDVTVAGTTPTG